MNVWLLAGITIVALILIMWLGNKVTKIFKGSDGEFSVDEFLRMIGAGSLLGLTIYMIVKEANRVESWQLFGSMYIFLVIGGFLTVVGLGKVLDTVTNIFGKDKNEES